MRLYIAILTSVIAVNCLAQVPARPEHFQICALTGANGPICLLDGEPFVFTGETTILGPDSKTFQTLSTEFELHDTPNGQLIIRAGIAVLGNVPPPSTDLRYVTADYSTTPPSIKLTKEPEKYSYWTVPTDTTGPIVNISNFKRPLYLSLDSETIAFNTPGSKKQCDFRKLTLSLDPKNQFKVKKLTPIK